MATLLAGCLASSGWALVPAGAAADPGVEPSNVTLTLGPGGTADVNKVVHTPPIPPKPPVRIQRPARSRVATPGGTGLSARAGVTVRTSTGRPFSSSRI